MTNSFSDYLCAQLEKAIKNGEVGKAHEIQRQIIARRRQEETEQLQNSKK